MSENAFFFRQENEKIQVVEEIHFTNLKFRKGQDFHDDQIVAYNIVVKDAYVFRKIVNDKYKLTYVYYASDSDIDRDASDLIRKFVNGRSDFYCVDGNLYNTKSKIICQASKEVMQWLCKSRSFYVNNQIYISFMSYSVFKAIVFFNPQPNVIFTFDAYEWIVDDYERCYGNNLEIIRLDPILFKDFKLSRELVKQLSLLSSFEEIKERVQKELFISVI